MTPTIDEILVGDEPDAWRGAGFEVDPDGACRIGAVRVRLVGRAQGKRILGWSLRDIDASGLTPDGDGDGELSVDGLPTTVSTWMSVFRKACQPTTAGSPKPFARAVRT